MIDYKHWGHSLILSQKLSFRCFIVSQASVQSLPVLMSYVLAAPVSSDVHLHYHAVILRKGMQWVNAVRPLEVSRRGEISGVCI